MPVTSKFTLPRPITLLLRAILVTALPFALILINARLLMGNAYLNWEYTRPDFPPDPFGFTTEDRLKYAPLAMEYLFNDRGIDFLAYEKMADGTPVYNERELSHMHDVKEVTAGLTRFGLILVTVYAVCVALLAISPETRPALFKSLLWGSVWTVALILTGLLVTLTSFQWLFTMFHRLFFTGDTWLFPTSDTLIRLFPLPFWLDAFALMFGGAILEAIILGIIGWRVGRKASAG